MIGFGIGPWTAAIRAGGAAVETVTYGESVTCRLGAQPTASAETEYGPIPRPQWRYPGSVTREDGSPTPIVVTQTASSIDNMDTRAANTGDNGYAIMAKGDGLRNSNGIYLTLENIPYAKYDVIVLLEHRYNSQSAFSCTLSDGQSRTYYARGNDTARWTGEWVAAPDTSRLSAFPDSSMNYMHFPDLSSATWELTVSDAVTSGYFSIPGFMVLERLDSLAGLDGNDPVTPPWQFYLNGDSYTESSAYQKFLQRELLLQENLFMPSLVNQGVGGNPWSAISARTQSADLTNKFMVLWDQGNRIWL